MEEEINPQFARFSSVYPLYAFSGLGADERFFAGISFPPQAQVTHVTWPEPLDKNESLASYAARIQQLYAIPDGAVLVGLSFGGWVAAELAQLIQPRAVVLISAPAQYRELPLLYRLIARLGLIRLAPAGLLLRPAWWLRRVSGLRTPQEDAIYYDVVNSAPGWVVRWGFHHMLAWRFQGTVPNLLQLHGSHDAFLPPRRFRQAILVSGGRHLMNFNRPKEIARLLSDFLANA